jgi:hypothetical protein
MELKAKTEIAKLLRYLVDKSIPLQMETVEEKRSKLLMPYVESFSSKP